MGEEGILELAETNKKYVLQKTRMDSRKTECFEKRMLFLQVKENIVAKRPGTNWPTAQLDKEQAFTRCEGKSRMLQEATHLSVPP